MLIDTVSKWSFGNLDHIFDAVWIYCEACPDAEMLCFSINLGYRIVGWTTQFYQVEYHITRVHL